MGLFSLRPLGWRGPLADSYWGSVAMVLCALTPFLVLSAAVTALQSQISPSVHLGDPGMQMSAGMADAAYCFGTILAVQLTSRLPGRRLLVVYAILFTVGSVITASASSPAPFFLGRILQGLSTSLMLITAAPALVLGFPLLRMRSTAVVMNMGIFGAVAVGPLIGGAFAGFGDWRLLFWIATGVGAVTVLLSLLTFADTEPMDRELEYDVESLLFASVGCGCAFFGASELVNHPFVSAIVLIPIAVGAACLIGMMVHQAFVSDPLMPIRQLGHTIPVAAIALAMFAGAGSVGLVGVLQAVATDHHLSTAIFWPEFGGAVLTAVAFGRLFFTRWVPVLAFAGLACLAGTAALMTGAATGNAGLIAVGTGGVGLGVGGAVAPGLFVAGFSLPSMQLQRIFALVEMLRGVAAFLSAPIILHVAMTTGSDPSGGIRIATWATTGLLVLGVLLVTGIVTSGGVRLQTPRLEQWQQGDGVAIESAPFGAALRRRREEWRSEEAVARPARLQKD